MAKLPQKPVNIVHDYFPAGADGSSPHTQDTPALFTDIESYEGDTALTKKEGKNLTTLVPEKRNNPEFFENPTTESDTLPDIYGGSKEGKERQEGREKK